MTRGRSREHLRFELGHRMPRMKLKVKSISLNNYNLN
jgi:hypothetical protein